MLPNYSILHKQDIFITEKYEPDIRRDPGNWVNVNMALHLGVGSIRAVEQHYYPFPGYDDFSNTVDQEMSLALE